MFTITTQEEANAYGQPIGAEIWIVPPPETFDEDFERLERGRAQVFFEALKREFHATYAMPSVAIFDTELAPIYDFIQQADAENIKEAFSIAPSKGSLSTEWLYIHNSNAYEYLRLKHGYYKNNWCNGRAANTRSMRVYGKYFLYKEWLEQQRGGLMPPPTSTATATNERIQSGFDSYVNEQERAKLMPYLVKKYSDKGPKEIVPMLYALEMLGVMTGKVVDLDQTRLHNALAVTFGSVKGRTALNTALHNYNPDQKRPSINRNRIIAEHRQLIEALLTNDKQN